MAVFFVLRPVGMRTQGSTWRLSAKNRFANREVLLGWIHARFARDVGQTGQNPRYLRCSSVMELAPLLRLALGSRILTRPIPKRIFGKQSSPQRAKASVVGMRRAKPAKPQGRSEAKSIPYGSPKRNRRSRRFFCCDP